VSVFGHGVEVCTSTTRPTPTEGSLIYETDTKKLMLWNGSAWNETIVDNISTAINSPSTLSLQTGGVDRLTIDNNGYVRNSARPRFFVWKDNGAVSAVNVIVFNAVKYNITNSYNTSNGRFTAPVDGTYYFCISGIGYNTGGTSRMYPRKNGATWNDFHLRHINTGNYADGERSWFEDLNAGDYVDIIVNDATEYGTSSYLSWYGFLLC